MYEQPFGAAATTSSTNDDCRRRKRCLALVLSAKRIRSGGRTVAIGRSPIAPDLVIAEITNAAWKFVIFDRMTAETARSAVREVVKAFEELVPTSVLKDRAFANPARVFGGAANHPRKKIAHLESIPNINLRQLLIVQDAIGLSQRNP
jgi:hypothetical protein